MITIPSTTVDWLLEKDNPPVKYLTMLNILDYDPGSKKVISAEKAINNYFVIREILKHKEIFWGSDNFYYRKYTGGFWQLIFLSDLYAEGSHPDIKYGCRKIMENKYWFQCNERNNPCMSCLTANILRSLIYFGYEKEELVRDKVEYLAESVVKNNGINCYVMDYSPLRQCIMALPKLLLAFNKVNILKENIEAARNIVIDLILKNEIYKYVPPFMPEWRKILEENNDKYRKDKKFFANTREELLLKYKGIPNLPKKSWGKFGYPRHYNPDILEVLNALADAGVPNQDRLKDALEVIKENAGKNKQWKMKHSLNGKMWINIEKKGEFSKWITYHAVKVLKHFEGLEIK